ncbi:MAG: hypothetical protein LBJ61_01825 [Deltaproteobacteria bacterium]|nr:hypothetical protein [Deltaproteobacteria bacterium]
MAAALGFRTDPIVLFGNIGPERPTNICKGAFKDIGPFKLGALAEGLPIISGYPATREKTTSRRKDIKALAQGIAPDLVKEKISLVKGNSIVHNLCFLFHSIATINIMASIVIVTIAKN